MVTLILLCFIYKEKNHPEKNRYFVHLPDNTVTELNGPPNNSCPINWGQDFSMADFDGDGKKDLVGFDGVETVCLSSDFFWFCSARA